MQSERLIFRKFNLDDIDDVFEFGNDDETCKFVTWNKHKNILESEKVITDYFMKNKYCFAIVEKFSNKCINSFEFKADIKNCNLMRHRHRRRICGKAERDPGICNRKYGISVARRSLDLRAAYGIVAIIVVC